MVKHKKEPCDWGKCKPDGKYDASGSCGTEYCRWDEMHCMVCRWYVMECGCHFSDGQCKYPDRIWRKMNVKTFRKR